MSHYLKAYFDEEEGSLAAEEEIDNFDEPEEKEVSNSKFLLSDALFSNLNSESKIPSKGKTKKQQKHNKTDEDNLHKPQSKKKPISLLSSSSISEILSQSPESHSSSFSDYDKLPHIHFDLPLTHSTRLNFSQAIPNTFSTIYVNDAWVEQMKDTFPYWSSSTKVTFSKTSKNHPTCVSYLATKPTTLQQENFKKFTSIMDYASCVDKDSGWAFVHGGKDSNGTVQNRLWAYNPKTGKCFSFSFSFQKFKIHKKK